MTVLIYKDDNFPLVPAVDSFLRKQRDGVPTIVVNSRQRFKVEFFGRRSQIQMVLLMIVKSDDFAFLRALRIQDSGVRLILMLPPDRDDLLERSGDLFPRLVVSNTTSDILLVEEVLHKMASQGAAIDNMSERTLQ